MGVKVQDQHGGGGHGYREGLHPTVQAPVLQLQEVRLGGVEAGPEAGRSHQVGPRLLRPGEAGRESSEGLGCLVLRQLRVPLSFPLEPNILEIIHLATPVLHARPAAPGLLGRVDDLLAVNCPGAGVVEYQPSLQGSDLPDGQEVS